MRIKNISSQIISLNDLDITISPGEIKDISHIDVKIVSTHKRLNLFFERGFLINLGKLSIPSSKSNATDTQKRLSQMFKQDTTIIIPKVTALNNKQQILTGLRDSHQSRVDSNIKYTALLDQTKNLMPDQNVRAVLFKDTLPPLEVTETGIRPICKLGIVDTGALTGDTTLLQVNSQTRTTEETILSSAYGNEVKPSIDIEKVKARLAKKCVACNSANKPCNKWAVTGFETCMTHMNRDEYANYQLIIEQKKQEQLMRHNKPVKIRNKIITNIDSK